MRISSLVNSFIKKDILKFNYMRTVNGGWERWFQLELAYYYYYQYLKLEKSSITEALYKDSWERADIVFYNKIIKSKMWMEIKCQTKNQRLDHFADLIVKDAEKMKRNEKIICVLGMLKEGEKLENLCGLLKMRGYNKQIIEEHTCISKEHQIKYVLLSSVGIDQDEEME